MSGLLKRLQMYQGTFKLHSRVAVDVMQLFGKLFKQNLVPKELVANKDMLSSHS